MIRFYKLIILLLAGSIFWVWQPAFSQTNTNKCNFTLNLRQGMTHTRIRDLQKFLNSHGAVLAPSGPGSKGNETDYFGSRTFAAVIKWQNLNYKTVLVPAGVKTGTGFFGVYSRAHANKLCMQGGEISKDKVATSTKKVSTTTLPTSTSTTDIAQVFDEIIDENVYSDLYFDQVDYEGGEDDVDDDGVIYYKDLGETFDTTDQEIEQDIEQDIESQDEEDLADETFVFGPVDTINANVGASPVASTNTDVIITLDPVGINLGVPIGENISVSWTKVSGPTDVIFSDPESLVTDVTVYSIGSFLLRRTIYQEGIAPIVYDYIFIVQ